MRHAFTPKEWKIICRHRTPYQVQQFLNRLPYNHEKPKETLRSFRGVVRNWSTHCLEAAISAAVILEQHGYPALLLDLESQDNLDHVLFLYQKDGRWGTVARSRDPGQHGRKPVFSTLRALVDSYADPYVDFAGRIVGYGVCNLTDLGAYDWRFSLRNVWKVERFLIEIPHRRFHMAEKRYQYWYQRYCAYKKRYPHRKPLYYPNRGLWTPGYPKNP
ncbi:MAG: hypothetical protein JRJ51_13830 [Deltaproteobacteria bacterium]|nr:hypothetical protein [Deltaproteobacteria bacterium]